MKRRNQKNISPACVEKNFFLHLWNVETRVMPMITDAEVKKLFRQLWLVDFQRKKIIIKWFNWSTFRVLANNADMFWAFKIVWSCCFFVCVNNFTFNQSPTKFAIWRRKVAELFRLIRTRLNWQTWSCCEFFYATLWKFSSDISFIAWNQIFRLYHQNSVFLIDPWMIFGNSEIIKAIPLRSIKVY